MTDTRPSADHAVHEHDCVGCRFLGTIEPFNQVRSNADDLYVCNEVVNGAEHKYPTLIRRYGSNPEDYFSMENTREKWISDYLDNSKYAEAIRLAFPGLVPQVAPGRP